MKSDFEILETAKQTIRTEYKCIENLLNFVDEEFVEAVRLLFSCNSIPRNYGDKSDAFYRRLVIMRFDNVVIRVRNTPCRVSRMSSRRKADGLTDYEF